MSQQETIEKNVRMALGDMHLQLIISNATIEDLRAKITALEQEVAALSPEPPPAVNGKDKPTTAPKEKPN